MGAVFIIEKVRAVIEYVVAALPERRFCVPAPESHRSVAVLVSSHSHIPFGRLFSCQGSSESERPPSSLDKGVQKYNPVVEKSIQFFLQARNVPLTITTGIEKSFWSKESQNFSQFPIGRKIF